MQVVVQISKSAAEKANKNFSLALVRVRKQVFNGLTMARMAAIEDMNIWLDERFKTYSRTDNASRHFKFSGLGTTMLGQDAILTTTMEGVPQPNKEGQYVNIGDILMHGSTSHLIPGMVPANGRMVFRFGKDAPDAGKLFKAKDLFVRVNHPGYHGGEDREMQRKLYEFMLERIQTIQLSASKASNIRNAKNSFMAAQAENPYYFEKDY